MVAAHTFFSRIVFYIVSMLRNTALADEAYIAGALEVDQRLISLVGLLLMLLILLPAIRKLIDTYGKNGSIKILSLYSIASVLAFAVMIPLDKAGV